MSHLLDRGESSPLDARSRTSTWVFRAFAVLVFGILTAQLWRLQIVDGRAYAGRSAANYLRTAPIAPQRGVIYDRNKQLLASNAPVFVVSITPADVPKGRMDEVMIRLANELRIPPRDIRTIVDRRQALKDYSPFNPIRVRENVDRTAVMRIGEHSYEMPGVQIGVESKRTYADGSLISHILGYMGPIPAEDAQRFTEQGYTLDDKVGAAGLEQWYEPDLRGHSGKRLYQVDVIGQEVAEIRRENARAGNNLALSLDLDLQRDVERILREGLRNSPVGVAIVMDPRNGEILAMADNPTFDNNIIGDPTREDELQAVMTDEKLQPMFPRAFGGQYAPGSVFKLVTGSAALQEGVATRDTIIDSKGEMWVELEERNGAKVRFPDTAAYGPQNFLQGLANSSNVYFFWLGGGFKEGSKTIFQGLGAERLAEYSRAFGYGSQEGLDIRGERDGIIPNAAWKQLRKGEPWYTGDTYNMSIGQGDVLVTPLQVVNVTAAIANGGTLYQPHFATAEIDPDGNVVKKFEPRTRHVPVEPDHLALMREAMEWTFSKGPWLKQFVIPDLRVGAKTGTAEFPDPEDPSKNATHGWFTAFAPVENPEVAIVVFVDNGTGSNDASPIGARILRRYFHLPDTSPLPPPPLPFHPAPLPGPPLTAQRP